MLVFAHLLALRGSEVDLGRSVAASAVDMNHYLVGGLLTDWSSCFHKRLLYSYKSNYNI